MNNQFILYKYLIQIKLFKVLFINDLSYFAL